MPPENSSHVGPAKSGRPQRPRQLAVQAQDGLLTVRNGVSGIFFSRDTCKFPRSDMSYKTLQGSLFTFDRLHSSDAVVAQVCRKHQRQKEVALHRG